MKKVIFEGSCTALVTPFNDDYSVNFDELAKLIEFQIENGTDAIVACGTTGESSTLTTEEHIEVVRFTIEKVAKRIPVIANAGSNDTATSIFFAKEFEKLGADGILLVTPYYNKTSQKGLVESYTAIANSTSLPCILYNVPSRTGMNILPQTYYELSKVPNIVATKEANGDISSVIKTIALCGDDLAVYSGNDDQTMPIMALGGKGVISVFSNVLPNVMHELCKAMLDSDYAKGREMTIKYADLMNGLFLDVNPIPVKEALNQMGYDCGRCRMPLTDMTDEGKAKITELLKKYELI